MDLGVRGREGRAKVVQLRTAWLRSGYPSPRTTFRTVKEKVVGRKNVTGLDHHAMLGTQGQTATNGLDHLCDFM